MNIILYIDNNIITNDKYDNILYLGYLLNKKKINTFIYDINNKNILNNIYNNYITTLNNFDNIKTIILNFIDDKQILKYNTIYYDINNIIYLKTNNIDYININNIKCYYLEEINNNIYNALYNNYLVLIKPDLKNKLLEQFKLNDINEIIYDYRDIKNYKQNIKTSYIIEKYVNDNNDKNIDLLLKNINNNNNINIIIYTLYEFDNYRTGEIVVLYYLAQLLSKYNKNVYIYNKKYNKKIYKTNIIYNNLINNLDNIELNNTIIIYSEGVSNNPLNGIYIIRWILTPLGYKCNKDIYLTWNKNDLIYYFNNENFNDNITYKTLTILYKQPLIKNLKLERTCNICYTLRKIKQILLYNNTSIFNIYHNENDTNITEDLTPEEYIYIFNTHKIFICYDTLTFFTCISLLCGCITIIYDIEGIDKKTWLKNTFFGPYVEKYNIENIYGLAYGISNEELNYAQSTIHLAPELIEKIIEEINNENLNNFINNLNINKFKSLNNTVENIFYK